MTLTKDSSDISLTVQRQTAVTAHLKIEQLPLFAFALQNVKKLLITSDQKAEVSARHERTHTYDENETIRTVSVLSLKTCCTHSLSMEIVYYLHGLRVWLPCLPPY